MKFDYDDILTPNEYREVAGLSENAYYRRVASTANPIIFNEYEIEYVKKYLGDRYNIPLARAIYNNEKVKLISLKRNPPKVKKGRPRIKLL